MRYRRSPISLRAYYHATWWALGGLTSLIAFFAELAPRPLVVVATSLAAVSLFPIARRVPIVVPRRLGILFLILCIAIGFFRYRSDGDIAIAIGCALIGLWPLALWYRELRNNNWLALVEVFLLTMVSLVLGEESIGFFLFLCISVAFIFNLNASYLFFHVGKIEASQTKMPPRYFWMFSYSVGMGFFVAIGIFLFLPRSIQWVNPLGVRQANNKSLGFGNDITLDGKNVGDNPALALRVETEDVSWLSIQGPTLYFRGKTVENFDGVRWRSVSQGRERLQNTTPLRFQQGPVGLLRHLKIYRQASPNDSVLYPGMLIDVIGPRNFRTSLRYDRHGNVFRHRSDTSNYAYEIAVAEPPIRGDVLSTTVAALTKSLNAKRKDLPNRDEYLQVPRAVRDKPYFRKWVAGLNLDPGRTDLRQVIGTLNREFKTRFKATYQHDMPATSAFAHFLSVGREGHCEYFASAAALYFRTLGIPTRVVLGYRGGDFNTLAKVLEVRDSSAHAWIEFFVTGKGWIPYDPTPPAGVRIFPSTLADYWQLTVSAESFWFDRYVVGYNVDTQSRLAMDLAGLKPTTKGNWKFSWSWIRWSNALWLLLVGLTVRLIWIRRRRRHDGVALPGYYRHFCRQLRRQNWERERSETFRRFHLRLLNAGADPAITQAIDDALHRDLYSRVPLSPAQRRQMSRRLRQGFLFNPSK